MEPLSADKRVGMLKDVEPRVREKILAVLMGHRYRLKTETLWRYSCALSTLARLGDLDDVAAMERIIPTLQGRLDTAIASYRHYCRWWRLPEPQIYAWRDRRRPLPKIPMEKTLLTSLTSTQLWRHWAIFWLSSFILVGKDRHKIFGGGKV